MTRKDVMDVLISLAVRKYGRIKRIYLSPEAREALLSPDYFDDWHGLRGRVSTDVRLTGLDLVAVCEPTFSAAWDNRYRRLAA